MAKWRKKAGQDGVKEEKGKKERKVKFILHLEEKTRMLTWVRDKITCSLSNLATYRGIFNQRQFKTV